MKDLGRVKRKFLDKHFLEREKSLASSKLKLSYTWVKKTDFGKAYLKWLLQFKSL